MWAMDGGGPAWLSRRAQFSRVRARAGEPQSCIEDCISVCMRPTSASSDSKPAQFIGRGDSHRPKCVHVRMAPFRVTAASEVFGLVGALVGRPRVRRRSRLCDGDVDVVAGAVSAALRRAPRRLRV